MLLNTFQTATETSKAVNNGQNCKSIVLAETSSAVQSPGGNEGEGLLPASSTNAAELVDPHGGERQAERGENREGETRAGEARREQRRRGEAWLVLLYESIARKPG